MFPFELYDHGVILYVLSLWTFLWKSGYECLHHCRLRYVYEKVKNKCCSFSHQSVLFLLPSEAVQ